MNGIKSQDIVVLLKLVSQEEKGSGEFQWSFKGEAPYSVRSLETLLGISKTEINASIKRSLSTGLAIKDLDSGSAKAQSPQSS
ncbi:hypothetical protein [Bradyrhizobium sp. BRP22]|uniref:hypothetical protein n=1 Tax=Bradyrhizobium sp. BRP22 TaxID=2793821 RepID=UPI0031FDA610